MIGFWKRDTGSVSEVPAGHPQGEAKRNLLELSDSAIVELTNLGQRVTLSAGQSLADVVADRKVSVVLVQAGHFQIDIGAHSQPLKVAAGQVITSITSERGCERIQALEDGVLLCLSQAAFGQLKDDTQLALLRHGQAVSCDLSAALLDAVGLAESRYQQLSEVLFQSLDKAAVQFAESEAVQQVIRRIPRLPVSSIDLLNRLMDENSTHAQVAELVRQDPALTALLLKAINSPGYSFGQNITDVSHAVSLLGFEGVYQIIMAESLRKSLPDNEQFRNSYQRALMLSYVAFALSQACGKGRPAEVSTIALLHDLGRVVIALLVRQNPSFKGVIKQVHPGVVGAQLLKDWQLPETVWRAIEVQHYPEFVLPERLPEAQRIPAALLYLSGWVLDGLQGKESSALFVQEYQSVLGMKAVAVDDCWEKMLKPLLRQRRNALPVQLRTWLDRAS